MRAVLLLLLLAGCAPQEETPRILFCPADQCAATVAALIANASRADCVFYDLDQPLIIDALARTQSRVVIDEDNHAPVASAGFAKRVRKGQGLGHNKFCVLDDTIVWTGSFNPTVNDDAKNNNNLVILRSGEVAAAYGQEFREEWHGVKGGPQTTLAAVSLGQTLVTLRFCPDDDCQRFVLDAIREATQSVSFMTFSFTDQDLAELIVSKKGQGIRVQGIVEANRITMQYEVYPYLVQHGIDVLPDANPRNLHHKVFIIDNETVITGSWNPSKGASEKNDENIVMLRDRAIAAKYLEEFNRLRRASQSGDSMP